MLTLAKVLYTSRRGSGVAALADPPYGASAAQTGALVEREGRGRKHAIPATRVATRAGCVLRSGPCKITGDLCGTQMPALAGMASILRAYDEVKSKRHRNTASGILMLLEHEIRVTDVRVGMSLVHRAVRASWIDGLGYTQQSTCLVPIHL